jgi:hypothetical protein
LSDAPATKPAAPAAPTRHKRKLSNYLIDKKLQLRYVVAVTIISAVIATCLGTLIYKLRHTASDKINADLTALQAQFGDRQTEDLNANISEQMADDDRNDALTMVGVGIGLAIILSGYLLIMTHKVAGPLYKVSLYFEKMGNGKLGKVTPLRSGDMLQDFYASFKEMHDAVRERAKADNAALAAAVEKLRASKNEGDYRGEGRQGLDDEIEKLAAHVAARKDALVDFPPRPPAASQT